MAGNAETLSVALAAAKFASGMAISAGGTTVFGAVGVAADATGQVNAVGGSSDGESSSEEEETDERHRAVCDTMQAGLTAGYSVRRKAAELFVDNMDQLFENNYKSIIDCAKVTDESERSNTIYKKDVQAAIDSGKETPPASQEDYFAESQESQHDLVYVDNDTDFTILSDKSSAQLLKMSAVHKVLAMQLEAKLEQDPLKTVERAFAKVRRAIWPCNAHAMLMPPCHSHAIPSHSISFHLIPFSTGTQERREQRGGDGFGCQVAAVERSFGVNDFDGAQLRDGVD